MCVCNQSVYKIWNSCMFATLFMSPQKHFWFVHGHVVFSARKFIISLWLISIPHLTISPNKPLPIVCSVECLRKHHMWWQNFYHPFSFSIFPSDLIFFFLKIYFWPFFPFQVTFDPPKIKRVPPYGEKSEICINCWFR